MKKPPLPLTVIISTYNSEAWLEKVLLGYEVQAFRDFEIIVADDGSGPRTGELISSFASHVPFPVQHLWHEDHGYRRQEILNRAIVAARHDYLVFTDGDCIPRRDFLHVHATMAQQGKFLSGGYCKLGMALSAEIGSGDIVAGSCFDLAWLKAREHMGLSNRLKMGSGNFQSRMLDWITPARATFNNCNSSAWKSDLLAVNGYDERMKYGGADRELGERLTNSGIKGLQIRHRAVCVHLDHARPYRTQEALAASLAVRQETKRTRRAWTPWGIQHQD